MDLSMFRGEITCAGSKPIFGLVLQEKFCKPAVTLGLDAQLIDLEKEQLLSGEGFIYLASWFNFYLKQADIQKLMADSGQLLNQLMPLFGEVFEMTTNSVEREDEPNVRSATYTFHCLLNNGRYLWCQLHAEPRAVLEDRTKQLFDWLSNLINGCNTAAEGERAGCYSYDEKQFYASYRGEEWHFIDQLHYVAQGIRQHYMSQHDSRLHKPDIVLQEDNLNRRHTFPDNWVLNADGLSTMLDRPNDVGLYTSICERHLKSARDFYNRTFPNRRQYGIGNFPIAEQQLEYLEYFEAVTTALLFSYTAIEAFVNSFIPDGYQHTKPSGKIMDKQKIERTYPLHQKLKEIMTDIYATPDPEQETWWQKLTALQDVRDQTIHTKQHLSQDRYSKLLAAEVFEIIGVYRTVIQWYGAYILKKSRHLINEFPFGFGYDDIYPAIMSDRTYRDIYNSLHNPWKPL